MESESFSTQPASAVTLTPCGQGCRYAEPMRGDYCDWMWCSRPGATTRVVHTSTDCRWFEAAGALRDTPAK